jgi:hypothetical protein
MSSFGAISGAGAGAPGGSGGCKRGRPLGSQNKAKDPVATPPVPQRRGHPPGSRNKKTLEALAAAAAAEPSGAGRSSAITAAPAGATSVAGLTGTPLEAVAALISAVMAVGAAPLGLADRGVGCSSSVAAGKARKPRRPPPLQQLSYTPKHGYTTSVVHLLAGCQDRLPLPASFIGTMGKTPPTSIMVEEGSGS